MVSTMLHNMVVGMGNSARSLVLLQEGIMDSSEEGRRMRDNPLTLSFTHTVEHCLWQAQSLNKHNNKWCGKWNIFFFRNRNAKHSTFGEVWKYKKSGQVWTSLGKKHHKRPNIISNYYTTVVCSVALFEWTNSKGRGSWLCSFPFYHSKGTKQP